MGRHLSRQNCGATLTLYGETYRCDRRRGHSKRRHRERMHGADERGQYETVVKWARWKDRRA